MTVNNVIDKLIEKGITTEGDSTRPEEGRTTGNVTLDSGNSYTLTEDKDTVTVEYNGPSDNIKPKLEIGKDTDSPTGKVTITITATDNVNGIKQILKDGTEINHYEEGTKTVTETVEITENGSYEIKVISGIDKETSQTITITNIDKDAPVVRYELSPEEGSYGKEVTITIIAEDSNGIASITTPEGTITKENLTKVNDTTYQTTYTVNTNGTYHFSVTDENGNKLEDYTVTIENVDKEGPEITGINKEVGTNTITVTVTEVRDVGVGTSGIKYRYFISKNGNWTEYGASATQEFTELEEGTEYTIKVQAKDSLGNEGEAFNTTVTTKRPDPNPDGEKFGEKKIRTETITQGNKTAVVPKGFAIGMSSTINRIESGLVITDKIDEYGNSIGNEFVWIPVEVTASDTETSIAAFQRTTTYDGTITPPSSSMAEPHRDMTASNDLTGEFSEYNEMIKSVYHNHGFYVARYEAGCEKERTNDNKAQPEYQGDANPVLSQKNKYVYTYVPWGASMKSVKEANGVKGAVELSRMMYPAYNDDCGAVSHLIYGVQWDAVLIYVRDSTHNVGDGSAWGNYVDYTGGGTYERSKLQKSGANENWKAKNIYDIAGNAREWSMEECNTDYREVRGGSRSSTGTSAPPSTRRKLRAICDGV